MSSQKKAKLEEVPAIGAPPSHLTVAREMRAQQLHVEETTKREASVRALLAEDADGSDIMFAPGRTDLFMGVQRDPNYHYLVCGENVASNGGARVNLHKFLAAGYEIAPLPDGKPADFPDIMRAILRVPLARYNRYRRHIRLLTAEANGMTEVVDQKESRVRSGAVVYDETTARDMVSANDLGILPPGVAAGQ